MQRLMLKEKSILGKVTPEEELKESRDLYNLAVDTQTRVFLPFIAFNSEKIKQNLRRIKQKLDRIGA
jgi:hypothetical protein